MQLSMAAIQTSEQLLPDTKELSAVPQQGFQLELTIAMPM
jgi:hypothetical protein